MSCGISEPTCSIGVCDSIAVCCGSAHGDGCVVDGENAKAALPLLLLLLLMHPSRSQVTDCHAMYSDDWKVSHSKRVRPNMILWGIPKSFSKLEIRLMLADMGLLVFSRGSVAWEGYHVKLVLQPKDSKSIRREVVCKISDDRM